ncbi:uncharacterized protein [Nicotiana tomentosiformis]|uniref:uncharacterized protein n=1 Tax=Nicotiana tomentosiformis TaxID=4098 RepID=UPI00388CBD18
MSDVNKLQPPRIIKYSISKKINNALSPKFRKSITLHEFFPGKFLHGGHVGATHVVSNTYEIKESNDDLAPMKTQEHHDNKKVIVCCTTISFTDDALLLGSKPHNRPLFIVRVIREQHLNCILVDDGSTVNIMPKIMLKMFGISIDELPKSNLTIQGFNQRGQRALGMIRVGLSIGDMKSNTSIHVIDAKTSYNLLLGRPWIHENGVVSSTLNQGMKYIRDGEIVKIDANINPFAETESYFADAKFYLDSCERSVEKPLSIDDADVNSKEENEAQWTTTKLSKKTTEEVFVKLSSSEVFDRIGGSTPWVSVFERLSHKGERVSSKHIKEVSTTSKTSVFCCLETTRKSPSRKTLSKHKEQVHEEQGHFEVIGDKEICSAFPSCMKRKSILSISTDGPLKVQRRTIIYTCHPCKEAEKEKEAMLTIQGSQRENSDFVETSYHITVEDSPCLNVNDEVHEAPPQLEYGMQSTVDEHKELNLGTPKDPRPTFISALLTPQEEEEYSKLLTEYKDVFAWSYKEMLVLSPKVIVHHLGIKSGAHPVK